MNYKFILLAILFLSIYSSAVQAENVESVNSSSEITDLTPLDRVQSVESSSTSDSKKAMGLKEQKDREGYLYDLKNFLKRSEKTAAQVDQKLEQKKTAESYEAKVDEARALYERGMALYQDGKVEEAEKLWQESAKISEDPELQAYYGGEARIAQREDVGLRSDKKELEEQRILRSRKAYKSYQQALEAYQKKDYAKAQNKFGEVEELSQNFLATRSYLMLIAKEISPVEYHAMANRFSSPTGDPTMLASQEDVQHYVRQQVGDAEQREVVLKTHEDSFVSEDAVKTDKGKDFNLREFLGRKGISPEELEARYKKALKAYERKQFEKAKELFVKINSQFPDYKDTRRYLVVIDERLGHESQMASDENYRRKVLSGELTEEAWRQDLEGQKQDVEVAQQNKAEDIYKEARVLYDQGDFEHAREKFVFVDKTLPDYRQTVAYLKSIDQKLTHGESASDKKSLAFLRKKNEINIEKEVNDPKDEKKLDAESAFKDVSSEDAKVNQVRESQLSEESFQNKDMSLAENFSDPLRQQEFNQLYETGEHYWNKGQWEAAQNHFRLAARLNPDHEKLNQYLEQLEAKKGRSVEVVSVSKSAMSDQQHQVKEMLDKERQRRKELVKMDKEQRRQIEKEVDGLYEQGVVAYKTKNYEEADVKLLAVKNLDPDYKAVETYLKKIARAKKDQELKRADDEVRQFSRQLREDRLKNRLEEDQMIAKMVESKKQEEKIVKVKESKLSRKTDAMPKDDGVVERLNVQSKTSLDYPNENIRSAMKSRRDQMVQIAQDKYDQALVFYKNKNYREAKHKFIEVEAMSPSYKETRSYLAKLETETAKAENIEIALPPAGPIKIKTQSREEKKMETMAKITVDEVKVEAAYQEAVTLYENKDYAKAYDQFEEIAKASPKYKKTNDYLKDAEKMIGLQEKDRLKAAKELAKQNGELSLADKLVKVDSETKSQTSQVKKSFLKKLFDKKSDAELAQSLPEGVDPVKVEALYQEAIAYYDKEDYLHAYDSFNEIVKVVPHYKKTTDYLKKSERLAAMSEKERLHAAKDLAKVSQGVLAEGVEEKPGFLDRFKKKSSEESVKVSADDEKISKLKENIAQRDTEDAQRVAKLERRHRARQNNGVNVSDSSQPQGMMAKVFNRKGQSGNMDQRKKDLEKMVHERRKVLKDERQKVQKEYEKSLADLYVRAETLYDAGLSEQANKIFTEIERLQPNYKDTKKYLSSSDQVVSIATASANLPAVKVSNRIDAVTAALDQIEQGM